MDGDESDQTNKCEIKPRFEENEQEVPITSRQSAAKTDQQEEREPDTAGTKGATAHESQIALGKAQLAKLGNRLLAESINRDACQLTLANRRKFLPKDRAKLGVQVRLDRFAHTETHERHSKNQAEQPALLTIVAPPFFLFNARRTLGKAVFGERYDGPNSCLRSECRR